MPGPFNQNITGDTIAGASHKFLTMTIYVVLMCEVTGAENTLTEPDRKKGL
jgi:hypothetical protein